MRCAPPEVPLAYGAGWLRLVLCFGSWLKPFGRSWPGSGLMVFEALIFGSTAPRCPVMQRDTPVMLPAEFPPIGPCVWRCRCSRLLDFIRGRHGVPRTTSQNPEALGFSHHTSCRTRTVTSCSPVRDTESERQRVLMVDGEVPDAPCDAGSFGVFMAAKVGGARYERWQAVYSVTVVAVFGPIPGMED